MSDRTSPTRRASAKRRIPSKTRRPAGSKYLVFVSHSTKDRWIARQIARLLEASGKDFGIKTFLDERDIKVGDSIPDSIRTNIQQCNEFLVLLTRNSLDRPWVLIEISAAWGHGKRIIAIIDKVAPEEMPEIMLPYKAVDLNDLDEYIKQLVERARGARR